MPVTTLIAPDEFTIHRVRLYAPDFLAAVCRGGEVCVDLSGVCHIDTAGLQLLIMLRREAAQHATHLEFLSPAVEVAEAINFCQLDWLLDSSSRTGQAGRGMCA